MELTLKIELTDEQYKDLMDQSSEAIFEQDGFYKALEEVFIQSTAEYLKTPEGIKMIRKGLCGGSYFYSGDAAIDTEAGKRIINNAASETIDLLKEPIKEYYKSIFKNDELIKNTLLSLLAKSMSKGLADGASDVFGELASWINKNSADISQIKSVLNVPDM